MPDDVFERWNSHINGKPFGGGSWREALTRGDKGPHATVANAVLVLGCDTDIAGTVAYDDFAHRIVVTRPPPTPYAGATVIAGPYPRAVTDTDITLLQGYIQRVHDLRISQPVAQQAVIADAEQHRVHPVKAWLDGLKWDGKPRVATWLHFAFGAKKDAYHEAVGTKFLCAAVRRVRTPGCKFDHVIVLEGHQGAGKSRACAALFDMEWFTDNLSHDLAHKDAQQGMAGKWGIELGELNVLVRSTNQVAKAFFSRQVDYYRPPYGKSFVERPRQCVFIGSTNESDYLSDPTGNRRYWPVQCAHAEPGWISDNREQLWAEAAQLEAEGETLWLDEEPLQRRATAQQARRLAEDVWTPFVLSWIAEHCHGSVRIPDLLHQALALPRVQQNRGAEMRVAAILRADGWMRHIHRGGEGKVGVAWFAPGEELPGRRGERVPSINTVNTAEEET